MKICYRFAAMGAVALAVALAFPAGAQSRRGGTLRHAHIGEPPTLDLHWTTATITQDIGVHIYEGLFTLNASYEPRPLLVERWSVSPNRLTFTFHLRQGVLFNHGRELTADDVVASLTRWG
ncbi:MAG: ABC transporter substrate-binding protein, partial [Firmicutes bacterium]|nr:ABC transporter substrate-binding protein [Bacillota bacterium]